MSGFGHYARTADELEREIVKRGIAIGLDWVMRCACVNWRNRP